MFAGSELDQWLMIPAECSQTLVSALNNIQHDVQPCHQTSCTAFVNPMAKQDQDCRNDQQAMPCLHHIHLNVCW